MEILTIHVALQGDVLKGPLVVAQTRCTPAGDVVNTVSRHLPSDTMYRANIALCMREHEHNCVYKTTFIATGKLCDVARAHQNK